MEYKEEILRITSIVDKGIADFLDKANEVSIGEFESIVEGRIIINLCIRYLESINELAKIDLVYLPSAMVLSRSLFESAINVLWLLYPSDIFECESRYIGRLKSYEDWITKQIKFKKSQNWLFDNLDNHLKEISSFRDSIQKLLVKKGYEIPAIPALRSILKSVNEERKYLYYQLLSGYTHGGFNSTWIYRKNLGTLKQVGEFIDLTDWKLVYSVSWPVFEIATELYIDRATFSKSKIIYSDDFKNEIREAINIIN